MCWQVGRGVYVIGLVETGVCGQEVVRIRGGLGEVVRVNDSVVTCSCNHTSERGAYPKGFTKLPWPRRWHGGPLHVSIMMLFSSPGSFALTRWDSHKRTKEENTYWPVWPDQNQQKSPKHSDSR